MVIIGIIIILILLIFILFFILIFTRVRFNLSITYTENQKELVIMVTCLKFIRYKKSIPLQSINAGEFDIEKLEERLKGNQSTNKNNSWDELKLKIDQVLNVFPQIRNALQVIKIHHFKWQSLVGFDSAHHTALLVGYLYMIKSGFTSMMTNWLSNETNPQYTISPSFNRLTYQTKLECILSFQFGQIMRELINIRRKFDNLKKVGTK